jgi:microcystin-dependent protein
MGLEAATFVADLVTTNPVGATDAKSQGDDHLRLIKSVLQSTFPNFAGAFNRVQTKAGNYNAAATDNASLLMFSAAGNLQLLAAATAGNRWSVHAYAELADITVIPNGAELINEVNANLVIARGSCAVIFCDGVKHHVFIMSAGMGTLPGEIKAFGGAATPSGYHLCAGQAISRTTYANLFAAIGTVWGVGDGVTTFNVPDFRGRALIGKDDMGGAAANRITNANAGFVGTTLGAAGGDERLHLHTHAQQGTFASAGQSNSHTHGIYDGTTAPGVGGGGNANYLNKGFGANGDNTGAASADHTHNTTISGNVTNAGAGASQNVPPSAVVNWIIKY